MKVKNRYLKLSGRYINGKEVENTELKKLLNHKDKTIINQILSYISNDLTTDQLKKFIEIHSVEKTFKSKEYQCVVKINFSSFGDIIIEVVKFGKRDMYKEMESQQRFRDFENGIIDDDISF